MTMSSELIGLEEQGWRALATSGEAAAHFYHQVLDDNPVMVLPGGMMLDDREVIIRSMSGQPWSAYELFGVRAFQPTADTGIVVYGATASRSDGAAYSAFMASTYVRRPDGWRLALHQQTPR
jgi:Domain of unknown function (DUF4440)